MKKIIVILVILLIGIGVLFIINRPSNQEVTETEEIQEEISTTVDKNETPENNIDDSVKEIEEAIEDINVESDFVEIGDI